MKALLLAGLSTAAFTGILATTSVANAGTLTQTSVYKQTQLDRENVPETYLNEGYGLASEIQNSVLSVQKFNSKDKQLKSVTVNFSGDIKADGGVENRFSQARTMMVNLAGNLNLSLPSGTSLLNLNPTSSTSYSLGRYDGRNDYAGASGRTFEGMTASASAQQTFTDQNFLQQFIGNGNLNFLFSAIANPSVTGSPLTSSYFDSYARGAVDVTYEYEEVPKAVPEPSFMLAMGLLTGVGVLSQRKKNYL
jgi:hypothetical protein